MKVSKGKVINGVIKESNIKLINQSDLTSECGGYNFGV